MVDITGGMFGVIGILAAMENRHRTGKGGQITCELYETTAFLVGQHMAQMAVTGKPAQPMPVRISAWAIYDVFETAQAGEQLFVGVVSDGPWVQFCAAFGLAELGANPDYAINNQRVLARDIILPQVRALFAAMPRAELVDVTMADGTSAKLPALPISFDGWRISLRHDLPGLDESAAAILREFGVDEARVSQLVAP